MGSFIFSRWFTLSRSKRYPPRGLWASSWEGVGASEENLWVCGDNSVAHWTHRSEGDGPAQAACSRENLSKEASGPKLPLELYKFWLQGLSSRPCLNYKSTKAKCRGMSFLAASKVLRAMFLLKLPIFFYLKWKQHKFSNYFQKAWFKLWLSSLWPKCIRPTRQQQNPLITAGISKQRQ